MSHGFLIAHRHTYLNRILRDQGHVSVSCFTTICQKLLHICICIAVLLDGAGETGRGLMHCADTRSQLHHSLNQPQSLVTSGAQAGLLALVTVEHKCRL